MPTTPLFGGARGRTRHVHAGSDAQCGFIKEKCVCQRLCDSHSTIYAISHILGIDMSILWRYKNLSPTPHVPAHVCVTHTEPPIYYIRGRATPHLQVPLSYSSSAHIAPKAHGRSRPLFPIPITPHARAQHKTAHRSDLATGWWAVEYPRNVTNTYAV